MVAGSQLVHPGALTVLGTPIDISRIACDTYVAAGFTDDITPWKTAYRIIQMVSGPAQFVMCSSGHIQTVVADPKQRGRGTSSTRRRRPTLSSGWRARSGMRLLVGALRGLAGRTLRRAGRGAPVAR